MLPDLPNTVHGVKSRNPFIVQCDECAALFYNPVAIITASTCLFSNRAAHTNPQFACRRMCLACWADHGWYEGSYEYVRDGSPEAARAMLERDHPNHARDKISLDDALALMAGGDAA